MILITINLYNPLINLLYFKSQGIYEKMKTIVKQM